jgi:hypothetical protein
MAGDIMDAGAASKGIDDYLTEDERRKLIANLHRVLCWMGVKSPELLEVDRGQLDSELEKFHQTEKDLPPEVHVNHEGSVELHHLIWRLVSEKELPDKDRILVRELIDLLEARERKDEDALYRAPLTHPQARDLYNDATGVVRALVDLKDRLKSTECTDLQKETIRRKVEDVKRWSSFVDKIKEAEA